MAAKNHHLSTRSRAVFLLGALVIVCSITLIGIFTANKLFLRTHPFDPYTTLITQEDGGIYQGPKKVGQFIPVGSVVEARLEVSPEVINQRYDYSFVIKLPANSPSLPSNQVGGAIITLQDPTGFQILPNSQHSYSVFLNNILPDAHTIIVVDLPAESITLPWYVRLNYWLLALPLAVWYTIAALMLTLSASYAFFKVHRRVINPDFFRTTPPNQLTPLEMAILLNSRLEGHHIAACIFDLAQRGFLQIITSRNETVLVRTSNDKPLYPYENMLLDLLAPQGARPPTLKDLLRSLNKDLFSAVVSELYIEVYDSLTAQGYFKDNLRLVHMRYKTFGIVVQFLSLLVIFLAYFSLSMSSDRFILIGLSAYAIGYIIYSTGYHIIPLTPKGEQATLESLTFGQYLTASEPIGTKGEQGILFFNYLPYAQIFKKEKNWLQRFRAIQFYIPDWFAYDTKNFFSPEGFYDEIEKITSLIGSVFVKVKDPNVD